MKYFLYISVVALLLIFSNGTAQSFSPDNSSSVVHENNPSKKLEFYPNPSKGSFKINVFDKEIKEIKLTIYDLNGSIVFDKVLSGLFPGISLDMKLRKPGLYLVKINTGKENIIEKLIVKP